jgi:hypothetical protein
MQPTPPLITKGKIYDQVLAISKERVPVIHLVGDHSPFVDLVILDFRSKSKIGFEFLVRQRWTIPLRWERWSVSISDQQAQR